MDSNTLIPNPGDSSFDEAGEYKELGPMASELEPEDFEAQAADIFATIRGAVAKGQPRSEGYRLAAQAYIVEAVDPRLRLQADIILNAPQAAQASAWLEQRKQRGAVSDSPQLREEKTQNLYQVSRYNHSLRELMWNNPGAFSADTLLNWLETGSGGEHRWAESIIKGIAAEVGAARVLQVDPDVKSVRFTTEAEDLGQIDLVVTRLDGAEQKIDVKTGGQAKKMGLYPSTERVGQFEYGIDRSTVERFAFTKITN